MSLMCSMLRSLMRFIRRARPTNSSAEKFWPLNKDSSASDAASSTTIEDADPEATKSRNASPSSASIASSATLCEPSKASLCATTLQGEIASELPAEEPHTFKKGHGICCNPDLMRRCLDHDSDEDVRTLSIYAGIGRKREFPSLTVCTLGGPSNKALTDKPLTKEERKRRKILVAKARLAMIK